LKKGNKNLNKGVDKMIINSKIKNYNEEESTKLKKLNIYESKFFGRICYGFGRNEDGFVYIKEDEADVVRMIYDMAINGNSLQKIQAELFNQGIKSPSGKDKWTRDVIDKTINNEKYLTYIISFENFVDASIEKESRCRYVRS
jgi:hypothetical protein